MVCSRIYPSFTDCTPLGESPPIVCTKSPSSIFSQGHECQRRVRYWGRWGEQLILGIRQQLSGSPFSVFPEKYVKLKSWVGL